MNNLLGLIFLCLVFLTFIILYREVTKKSIHIWLWSYITRKKSVPDQNQPIHIMFAFCDHYEPKWGNATYEEEVSRVDRWHHDYPILVQHHRDADGCFPKHSFFFPEEEYREEHLSKLTDLCIRGYGEIEIHIHHDDDTVDNFSQLVSGFLKTLDKKHGVIARDPTSNQLQFAFIHGDWALDNSRKDGSCCGIDNELTLLSELGCYADFTLPSAPSDTQTKKINSLYYAEGKPGKTKSHNNGIDVEAGKPASKGLLIIQGILRLNWKNRKFGLFPKIENSDIRASSPPSQHRIDMWVECAVQVKKQAQWRFVKIHTHGTQEEDMDTLLEPGNSVDQMHDYLENKYNDGKNYILHYVSAREMFNIVKAAEANKNGNPNEYRDFILPPPPAYKISND